MLDDRLTAWLNEYDALTACIADLGSGLAFLEALAGGGGAARMEAKWTPLRMPTWLVILKRSGSLHGPRLWSS